MKNLKKMQLNITCAILLVQIAQYAIVHWVYKILCSYILTSIFFCGLLFGLYFNDVYAR